MPSAHFSVIVVSWNVREPLRLCLKALQAERTNTGLDVLLVDNNSRDGTVELVRREFPWVKLTAAATNLGFAAACNQAARQAGGEYLLFLNPDTEVTPGFFSDLEREFLRHPQAAVVGGHLLNPDGTTQPSVRGFPTVWPMLLDSLKLLKRFPWLAPTYLKRNFDYSQTQAVEQVMGACLAVPKPIWQRLKGFDPGFFVWFEEVDFCQRARAAGYQVWYSANLTLMHESAQSFRQLSYFQRHYLYTQSLARYAGKHLGKWQQNLLIWASAPWFAIAIILDHVASARTKS